MEKREFEKFGAQNPWKGDSRKTNSKINQSAGDRKPKTGNKELETGPVRFELTAFTFLPANGGKVRRVSLYPSCSTF